MVFTKDEVAHPDILVVCDKSKFTKRGIKGAPNLIIEVLSPSNIARDKRIKKLLYERHSVKEYIIVDPMEKYVKRSYLG